MTLTFNITDEGKITDIEGDMDFTPSEKLIRNLLFYSERALKGDNLTSVSIVSKDYKFLIKASDNQYEGKLECISELT